MKKKPKLWVVAGPNGAGKTTLVEKVKLGQKSHFVNPDVIAKEINPNHQDDVVTVIRAGRIAREQHIEYLNAYKSFGIETTLSGHAVVKMMEAAKEEQYQVHLAYVGLENSELSNSRVMMRTFQGGHSVPEEAIKRRYPQSLDNLAKIAPIVDKLYVFDNSDKGRRLLLNMEQEKVKYLSKNLPDWAEKVIPKIIEQRVNLIPSQNLKPLSAEVLAERVLENGNIKSLWENVEQLAKLVYGRSDALNKDLASIVQNPKTGETLANRIETAPETVASLAGSQSLLGKDATRKTAEANIYNLGQAVEDYGNAVRRAREEITQAHEKEQKRMSQSVSQPDKGIKQLLDMLAEQRKEALEKSPQLQEELQSFVDKLHNRLAPNERAAIIEGNHAQLAKSLGVSEAQAKQIGTTGNIVKTVQQSITRTAPALVRDR